MEKEREELLKKIEELKKELKETKNKIKELEKDNEEGEPLVEFVSYTGKYPNLCYGDLTVLINGEKIVFSSRIYSLKDAHDNMYPKFWSTGGTCSFTQNYDAVVTTGPWQGNIDMFPKKYKRLAYEILRVFNENVPFGCCGGCI